jgi:hypothetical protein
MAWLIEEYLEQPFPPSRFDRAERIGEFWGHPRTREFGELLIDLEEDKAARAVVFVLLAEMERR